MEFLFRALIVGGLATVAALTFEQALLHARMATRYAWTLALLLTIALPFVPQLSQQPVLDGIPVVSAPAMLVTATSNVETGLPFNVLLTTWLLLVALALGAYVSAYVRLRSLQREWRAARIHGTDVFVSNGFGPAVFGFVRPRIVVPGWVENASPEDQKLIILHEREHIRRGDQLQLLLSMAATVVMPWNPFVWFQSRRLGFRVETDCDARVLASTPDAQRYATLLVNVGAKQTGLLLTPALAEERSGLERRLKILATRIVENRWKAAALLVMGMVLTVMACEARLPNDPQQPQPQYGETTTSLPRKQQGTVPTRPTVDQLMEKHYPLLLRAKGIGGVVGVQATVRTSGVVDNSKIVKSSGHDALDQAALRVVQEMELLPLRVPSGQQPQDEVRGVYLHFIPEAPAKTMSPDTPPPVVLPPVRDPKEQPHFTPFTEKAVLANRDEVIRALARNYPPVFRDAGIGGTTLLWTLLDETGRVTNVKVKETSGHEAIDSAAVTVAKLMRFTPAKNRGKAVKVWIQLPVVFKTK